MKTIIKVIIKLIIIGVAVCLLIPLLVLSPIISLISRFCYGTPYFLLADINTAIKNWSEKQISKQQPK